MKVLVELDLYKHTYAEYSDDAHAFQDVNGERYISVDSAYLKADPSDEIFYLFKVVEITDFGKP